MFIKINDSLINKNEILAIIPLITETKKKTTYEIIIHVKSYNQFSKQFTVKCDCEEKLKEKIREIQKELLKNYEK